MPKNTVMASAPEASPPKMRGCQASNYHGGNSRPRLNRAQTALLRQALIGLTDNLDTLEISPDRKGFVMFLSRAEVERLQEVRDLLLQDETPPVRTALADQHRLPGME